MDSGAGCAGLSGKRLNHMALWVRFARDGETGFGTLAEGVITAHTGTMFGEKAPSGEVVPLEAVHLLAPVTPRKFIGLWNNFHELAAKLGTSVPEQPLWFLKSPDSVVGPDAEIVPPESYQGKVLYEGELGIVIGQDIHNADEAAAEAAIFGYTAVNDVTALDILNADPSFPQWARAKSCDTFGPIGPAIATGLNWQEARIRVALNGRERQNYPASDMILSPARIVSLLSQEMTLCAGDVIACGTSVGVLPMRPGMVVEVTIDGIGTLRNTVAQKADAVAA
ncbi:Fumarylacetoacetate hydrolase family protein [Granulibacter bethesdensis]|uniref:Fumarylacetoacetate hydrolase family protein n=2 Tax=Granulibacter bethesdensis TaxID=364410 RepID=A0AAC9K8P6_9PROT|nr:Fumarylacetoacetate hydrolase family protein [Granulibacter bethesdensis]APH61097.1 Fumarylacetoacetate hydrolase family protein [Granulibacter bethesdensis]